MVRLALRSLVLSALSFFAFQQSARAYWQQHVTYDIRVTLIDSIHTLDGTLSVVYANHSPDTLREVYFHLYSNAFQPGSMMDERALAIHSAPVYDRIHKLPESEWGKYWIHVIACDGTASRFEITGTIMRVTLPNALAPGDSVTIAFPFREQIPRQIRRSGWMSAEHVQYSMAQWYPKIAEYDADGWQTQEYVSREFYGVWGDFRVEITLPSRFTVGATGECLNPKEVGHGYDQIAAGATDGIALPNAGTPGLTTWKFHASPVHDFAWVADDDYIHEWMTWNDSASTSGAPVTIHAFYKHWAQPYWEKNALAYSLFSLSTYSHHFGPYAYRNFSCTMAGDGGMEYPQLIMITGYRPNPLSLAGVIAHEVGHQWFYGMLGSNETREAFMDEGFTTYVTTMCMNALFGDRQEYPGQEHSWLDWFIPKFSNKRDNYRGYQEIASQGYEEPLDIPHDWFREDATAGQVYGKTAAILNMLEYTLGDSTFAAGMKEYYNEWHFKHPHLTDFKRVMEKVSHTSLDWFFDEWFKTTRTVDYEAVSVSSIETAADTPDRWWNQITLRNNGLAVMPIDLLLHYEDGTTEAATIPLAVNKNGAYRKSPPIIDTRGINVNPYRYLPEWDWTAPDYKGILLTPKRISWFEIDTSWRLQDLNWLNNYSARAGLWMPPGAWAVWKQLNVFAPIDEYYSILRPIVSYDQFSKMNVGLGTKFGMNNSFSGDAKILYKFQPGYRVLTDSMGITIHPQEPWYDDLDGALTYSTPIDWLGRLGSVNFDAEKMYGIATLHAAIAKTFRPEYWRLGATHSGSLFIEDQRLLSVDDYPIWHPHWGFFDPTLDYIPKNERTIGDHTTVAGFTYALTNEREVTHLEVRGETSVLASDPGFSRLQATFRTEFPIIGTHGNFRFAAGTATENTPYQRRFWLARADNYEEQSSGFYRAVSSMDATADEHSSLFVPGGAGVRGYNAGNDAESIFGTQMAGASFDLDVPNPIAGWWSFFASLRPALFADAGWAGNDWYDSPRAVRTDAGVELAVELLSWLPHQLRGVAEEYDPIPAVAFYFPFYENHPVDGTKNVAFRWALSIGADF